MFRIMCVIVQSTVRRKTKNRLNPIICFGRFASDKQTPPYYCRMPSHTRFCFQTVVLNLLLKENTLKGTFWEFSQDGVLTLVGQLHYCVSINAVELLTLCCYYACTILPVSFQFQFEASNFLPIPFISMSYLC